MKKKKRRKNTIFKNWDNYKRYNVYKADTRRQRKTERNRRNIWKKKKITEIFFKLMAVTKKQIQRVQRTPSIINTGEKELHVGIHFQIT